MRQKTALGYLFVFAFLMSAGCAGLPPIVSLDNFSLGEQSLSHELNQLFPADSFQFVHAIELTMPGSHSAMLMGVVNIHPRHRAIHCVVMTLEGLVLFEADHTSDAFIIHRAIPPFDSQAPVFPKSITLTAAFPSRYTLTMTLTDASLISDTFSCGDNK
ncbi:hypothetical protein [Desulfobacter sp.]|uniref:hypothetical protein n=1 Tax=Desulfobacter sp. TaxID=2294 RepID=UPI003D0F6A35